MWKYRVYCAVTLDARDAERILMEVSSRIARRLGEPIVQVSAPRRGEHECFVSVDPSIEKVVVTLAFRDVLLQHNADSPAVFSEEI